VAKPKVFRVIDDFFLIFLFFENLFKKSNKLFVFLSILLTIFTIDSKAVLFIYPPIEITELTALFRTIFSLSISEPGSISVSVTELDRIQIEYNQYPIINILLVQTGID